MKKIISLFLSIIMIVNITIPTNAQGQQINIDGNIVKVIRNNNKFAELEVTKDGTTVNLTLDKETYETKLIASERKFLFFKDNKEFDVEIGTLDENSIDAIIKDNNHEYKISSENKLKASFVIPLIMILGEAILKALLGLGLLLVAGGITYAIATAKEIVEELSNQNSRYYFAKLVNRQVHIGPACNKLEAAAFINAGGDIMSTSHMDALALVSSIGGADRLPENHGKGRCGYYIICLI